MVELYQETKDRIREFCEKTYEIIEKDYPRIRSIIVQLNCGKLYIGRQIRGTYKPTYYFELDEGTNPSLTYPLNKDLVEYVKENKQVVVDCYNKVQELLNSPGMRSYNIFYYRKDGKINICKNRIGSRGINKCRIYNEF